MKKKNLNFLLALLAALALVFAGACSDGSDSETTTETVEVPVPYEYTGDYSGETWTYSGAENPAQDKTTITSIELQFAESGNGVVIVVDWWVCSSSHSESHANDCASYTATIDDATYTALGGYVGIVLPTGADNSDNVTALTFTVNDDGDTLTLAGTNAGTSSTPAYTVADDSNSEKTVDIFGGTSPVNALVVGTSTFSAPTADSGSQS